jgi:hydrogenase maturation protein HypF
LSARRRRIRVTGTVQGVGFRPFVYREAVALGLSGFVCNDAAGVLLEAEGDAGALDELCTALAERPPPLARVQRVETATVVPLGAGGGFRILESEAGGSPSAPVSVDVATCADCLGEVADRHDRRAGYPFTNCTNCGPRYTIVLAVPYDRAATTMVGFTMCPACKGEYDDPGNRRFHAQPNSCPDCGPRLFYRDAGGSVLAESGAALDLALRALSAGAVLGVKGIGGYHLAARADDEDAVALLRRRKARDDKPFALMVRDVAQARDLCLLGPAAEEALASIRRPIVLARRRVVGSQPLAAGVAPGLPELGVMLPYTPLHHLLLAALEGPLVMTSGNLSDDPIAHLDGDAVERLGPLVDAFLAHDRPIHIRCDDSVVRDTGEGVQMVRRSRGYAPEPLALPAGWPARRQVLAVGAELKSTVAVAKDGSVVASHHIGDLEHLATYRSFLQAAEHLCHLFAVTPEVVVHDLHPEYLSTKYAEELDIDQWSVQHHHAHIASCLVDNGSIGPVLGVAFDGLGLGPDGLLWGGEWLVADLASYRRVGHLAPVAMPGGAAAIREPWRMAISWAAAALGTAGAASLGPRLDDRWRAVLGVSERDAGVPRTTSAGRLFDAVAALAGIRSRITYEGQAAIELEALASTAPRAVPPAYPVEIRVAPDGTSVLDPAPLVAAVAADVARGVQPATIAATFHESFGVSAAELAVRLAAAHGLGTVALSGGVFQNVRLTRVMTRVLEEAGLCVLRHRDIPPNDGGIAIGQAAIGAGAAASPVHGGS